MEAAFHFKSVTGLQLIRPRAHSSAQIVLPLGQDDGYAALGQQILDGVWGADYYGTARTVDNFVGRLRQKLEDDPKKPRFLVTVRGAGYRFQRSGAS